jgi:signal transduction histidine kinase
VRDAQGNIVRYVTVQIDVDDLKQAEALLAAEVKLLEMVARSEPLAHVLKALSRDVEELCRGCVCGVLTVAPDRKHFRIGAGSGLPHAYHDFFEGKAIDSSCDLCSLSVIEKTPVISADLAHDPRWEGSPWLAVMYRLGFASCCAMPVLAASGEVSGVLAIHRPRADPPAPQEQTLIDRFAKIAGIAINREAAEEALNQTRNELAHVTRVATLNAMTASIAHEVSQPLSGILTNANTCARMLAADPPNLTVAAETVRRTIRDANRATEIIQRLRAMFTTKPTTTELADLNELAREVIALSMGELRRAGVLLETEFAEELPRIRADRVQLQQVILNLLLNAGDAMAGIEDRPRTLLVGTGLHDGGSVRLLVRDSGTGIDPEKIGRLFEAFYTTKPKGMGIGLSISRSIIERHNGRLWAENNAGPGATFSFSIPSAPD